VTLLRTRSHNNALQLTHSGYTGGMQAERGRSRRVQPFTFLAVVLLITAYVAAYFAFSKVRVRPGTNGSVDARYFGSKPALSFFRPMKWIESKFVDERRFGHRSR